MKKQLFSILTALTVGTVLAQTPSPSWTISQNASFPITNAGHRFLDAVDANVVWLSGYDGINASRAYNWYSRTINGGASYTSGNIFADTNTYLLSNMEGIDANTAWVCVFFKATQGDGAIFRTTNGGSSWTNMTATGMFTNTSTSFGNFVSFFNTTTGIVNGDPVNGEFELWRTTNGGTAWSQISGANIPDPLSGEFAITNLYCKEGTSNLWFGTNKGRMYRTTDQGQTWSVGNVTSSTNATVTEVAFSSATNGVAYVVGGTPATFQVYNTTDGGATWNAISTIHPNLGRNDICNIPGTGYLASVDNQNQILSYSMDNGVTWIDWQSVGIPYVCIDMVNSYTGWVAGFSDATTASVGGIYKYNGIDFLSSFTVPQYICLGTGPATISPVNNSAGAISPLSYTWSASPGVSFNNANATTPVVTFTANGTYTVNLAVSNTAGTNSSNHIVTVLTCAQPVAGFNVPANICNNVQVTFTNTSVGAPNPAVTISSNPASNVTITPGSGSLYSAKFQSPGTYTVTMVATNAAGSNTFVQNVVVADCSPTVNFSFPISLCHRDTALTINQSIGGTGNPTWSITPSQGVYLFQSVGANRKIAINNTTTTPTTYTLSLKVGNVSGTNTITHVITVYPLPTITVSNPSAICVGEPATLTAQGGTSYAWSGASTSSVNPLVISPTSDVIYTVNAIDVNSCKGSAVATVSVNACTGFAKITNNSVNVSVYPNPAHENIYVSLPGNGSYNVKLTNVLGAVIYNETAVNKEKVSMSLTSIPKGIYFVTVESKTEKVTRKVVIE
jgi:hypothetical protein